MAEKEEYNSTHDGPTIDAAVTQAKPGGTLDTRLRLSLYTTLEQIGVTVGSETMEAIARALPNNAVLEVSCSARNNSATDGTAFPVSAGGSSRYGILRVARISGSERVSFEFRAKEPASRMYVGFWSTDGGWTGWKKVYTEGSKPTAAELEVLSLGGGVLTGALTARQFVQSQSAYENPLEIGQYIDMHLAGSAENYDGRLSLDAAKYLMYNGNRVYHEGNKPTLADLGIGNISQIAVVSYTGTGGSTSGNSPVLTFPLEPKFVLVVCVSGDGYVGDVGYFARDIGGATVHFSSIDYPGRAKPTVDFSGNTLHYYASSNPALTLNASRATYAAIALG